LLLILGKIKAEAFCDKFKVLNLSYFMTLDGLVWFLQLSYPLSLYKLKSFVLHILPVLGLFSTNISYLESTTHIMSFSHVTWIVQTSASSKNLSLLPFCYVWRLSFPGMKAEPFLYLVIYLLSLLCNTYIIHFPTVVLLSLVPFIFSQ
jgi:hypothetical protein